MIASLAQVVRQLRHHGVRFVVIGGWPPPFYSLGSAMPSRVTRNGRGVMG